MTAPIEPSDELDVMADATIAFIQSGEPEVARENLRAWFESYVTKQVVAELKMVKSGFADLQDAEEAVYIESNYIDPRIAKLEREM